MDRRRPSLIGPLILITIGALFLLANLGYLPLSFWEIAFRFWPLILVLMGLELVVGRHSVIGALVVVALWFALLAGVFWLALSPYAALPAATPVTDRITQPLGDVTRATVNLSIGAGRVFVNALDSDSTNLAQGTFAQTGQTRIVKTYDVVGTEGRLTLKEEGFNFILGGTNTRWDLAFNPHIPLALQIDGGLGRATLDLTALNLSALTLNVGIGSIDVTAPKAGVAAMRVNGGIGSATITLPAGVAARIRVEGGLGSTRVDSTRFPKEGATYQSADYATTENKVDLHIQGGIGSVTIR